MTCHNWALVGHERHCRRRWRSGGGPDADWVFAGSEKEAKRAQMRKSRILIMVACALLKGITRMRVGY